MDNIKFRALKVGDQVRYVFLCEDGEIRSLPHELTIIRRMPDDCWRCVDPAKRVVGTGKLYSVSDDRAHYGIMHPQDSLEDAGRILKKRRLDDLVLQRDVLQRKINEAIRRGDHV